MSQFCGAAEWEAESLDLITSLAMVVLCGHGQVIYLCTHNTAMLITSFTGLICSIFEVFKQLRWDSQNMYIMSLYCVKIVWILLVNLKLLCGTEQVATAADAHTTQMSWDVAAWQPRPVLEQLLR